MIAHGKLQLQLTKEGEKQKSNKDIEDVIIVQFIKIYNLLQRVTIQFEYRGVGQILKEFLSLISALTLLSSLKVHLGPLLIFVILDNHNLGYDALKKLCAEIK